MRKTYQITEYGSFVRDKEVLGSTSLPPDTFDALENFVLSNSTDDADALELMGISARKGVGKIITAKNYVGIITMNDGTTIEILPKVYSAIVDDANASRTKKLLIDMLKTLRDSPYKALQTTNVNIEKMNVFEIFIRMFLDEVFYIVKRGIKCSYETIEENATFSATLNLVEIIFFICYNLFCIGGIMDSKDLSYDFAKAWDSSQGNFAEHIANSIIAFTETNNNK